MRRRMTVGRAALYALELGLLALLLANRDPVAEAVRQGLTVCVRSVVPALFPCFAAVSLAVDCGVGELPPPAWSAFFTGALGGYPTGARTVGQLYRAGALPRERAVRLLGCCSNAGPAFILGVAGAMFSPRWAGAALWGVHLLPPLIAFLLVCRNEDSPRRPLPPLPDLPSAFVSAVTGAADAMVHICGFVVLFSVILRLVSTVTVHPLALGALELTWGVLAVSDSPAGFILAAALLGWGGASVHCQTAAVLAEAPLPLGRYLAWKMAHGLLSMVLAVPVSRLLWP